MDTIELGEDIRFGQNAVVTGNVAIGARSNLWHNVVVRGDVAPIRIGERVNLQDGTIVHGQLNEFDVAIGNDVSVGHLCVLHGCELADESFVGMGCVVMNGAYIGPRVFVAAGSLIVGGSKFEDPETMVVGRPGKAVRKLKPAEIDILLDTPKRYLQYAQSWLPPYEGN